MGHVFDLDKQSKHKRWSQIPVKYGSVGKHLLENQHISIAFIIVKKK